MALIVRYNKEVYILPIIVSTLKLYNEFIDYILDETENFIILKLSVKEEFKSEFSEEFIKSEINNYVLSELYKKVYR